jgi:ribosome-associated toxin RatA of RatAB toxin-antitoxin module
LNLTGGKPVSQIEFERTVNAPRERVWAVISDHEGFGEAAPSLSHVEVVEGEGFGMRRRCYNAKGRGWSETCTLWEDGHRYAFEVDTSDYPYPFSRMAGTWGAEPAATGTRITMLYEYEYRRPILGRLLDPFVRLSFRRVCERILDRWEADSLRAETAEGVGAA